MSEGATPASERVAPPASERVTPARLARIRAVLAWRQPDLTVLLDAVNKPHNLSAILRTCDAVGVLQAHAVPPRLGKAAAEFPDFASSTFGATSGSAGKWVDVRLHGDTVEAVRALQAQGFQVLATHLSDAAFDYREADYTRPTCVLLGAERFGVLREAAEAADGNIVIPMMGMVQSLNVSVAAATILFEAQRQRLAAGLYDAPRLADAEFERLAEDWCRRTLMRT